MILFLFMISRLIVMNVGIIVIRDCVVYPLHVSIHGSGGVDAQVGLRRGPNTDSRAPRSGTTVH